MSGARPSGRVPLFAARSERAPVACALAFLVACKSSAPSVVDAAPDATPVVASTSAAPAPSAQVAEPPPLDDRCAVHADCVALDHFVDPDWRCCLGCGGTVAATATWAKAFLEFCAATKAMRECPVPQCDAGTGAARCIAGRCALLPGHKL